MPDLSYGAIELNREYGPWQYPWRALIERYLEATENAFPWHRERSPWGPPVAPPTLLGNATLRFLDSIAPVPPGTLHAKFDLEITNALRGDRELVGYGRFVEKYERRGRRWAAFTARWRDGPGLLVGHSTVTMAFPEVTEKGEEGRGKERAGVGEREAELTLPPRALSREKIAAYSEDSANAQRGQSIHANPHIAEAKGFPDAVAQGMMSADYISELMTGRFERGWLLQGRLSLAFVAPSFAGDTLTAKAAKREELDEGAFTRHVYDAWCENQRGEVVTAGTASGVVAAGR
ncbi:MAG: MaoC family dehydratase [Dehalococcoidia bacterium]|nr:MaoC family dehydratase [Dehalococcoidia bacterium]